MTTSLDISAVVILARQRQELAEQIAVLEERREALRARFESMVPIGFRTEIDGKPVFRLPPPRAFDLKAAMAVASRFDIPVNYVTEVDASDLKLRLRVAGLLDDAMVPGHGKPRVSL